MTAKLQQLLDEGVASATFPQAAAVVLHRGATRFVGQAGEATAETVFDLASLTKVMSTTAAFLWLWGQRRVSPQTLLADVLPTAGLGQGGATFEDLLTHRSGAPAYVPYYAQVLREWPALLEGTASSEARAAARQRTLHLAAQTAAEQPLRTRAVYSDVGFIVLGGALEALAGCPLDALWDAELRGRLGLRAASFRRLSSNAAAKPPLPPPTGRVRPRPPAPGQAAAWDGATVSSPPGEVDDDNAWAMDGVAGHAGLFGTADDVARFGQAVLDGLAGRSALAPAECWARVVHRDDSTPGSTRALGFDTPASERSSGGTRLGKQPPGAVGHLGFTGTSLWVDLARELVVALCTHRTFLGRDRTAIQSFRPRFHDAVLEELTP